MTIEDNVRSLLDERKLGYDWMTNVLGWKPIKLRSLFRHDSTYLATVVQLARALNANLADIAIENRHRKPNHLVFNCTTYGGVIMAAAGYQYPWYAEIARKTGTTRQNVHRQLTRGNLSLKTLEKIANAIGLTLEELLQWPEK